MKMLRSDFKDNSKVQSELNGVLADEYVIFTKTLKYHWNVVGPRFQSLHEMLGEQYQKLLEIMDGVAERNRMIGGTAIGSLKEFEEGRHIDDKSDSQPSTNMMIKNLYEDHSAIQDRLSTVIKSDALNLDLGTEDFLTGVLQEHEKMAWMLRSHLEQ